MSDKKISQLTAVTDVQDGDDYVVVRSGANYKITGASLSAAFGGGSLPASWTENEVGGLEIEAPTDLTAAGALVVRLAAGTDPADENSVIQIIGRDGSDQAVSFFDVDQGGGFYLQMLDPTAQAFIRACTGQTAVIFRIVDSPGGATLFQVAASGVATTKGVIFPTSDPHVAGAWWDNAGTLTKSSG